jgi:hypothetical protein
MVIVIITSIIAASAALRMSILLTSVFIASSQV